MKILSILFISLLLVCACQPFAERQHKPEPVSILLHAFDPGDVTLLDGPFQHARDLNAKILLDLEPDRFLATFRMEAGLRPKAERYGGWESSSVAGHSLGHYLSGCAMMYRETNNPVFLERVQYIIEELSLIQQENGDGYIGAFPGGKRVFEEEVAAGVIRASAFDLNGIWAPWYNHHKMLAGLRDAYLLCDNQEAFDIAVAFSDWIDSVVGHLPHDVIQEMLICEYGGMNEVLADMYGLTADRRYLKLSKVFHDVAILDSLALGVDVLEGKHANTQIAKVVGVARRHELTGNKKDGKTATFFWDRVANHHSYATGSNALNEYFGPPGMLSERLGPMTGETCNVYNMLKLTDHIFRWSGAPQAADFYELALFNHILASQNPENGRVTYHINIDMGGTKAFQDPHYFTCCVGTGMENHSKYSRNIYYHNDQELYVVQFIASELNWKDKGLVVRQQTGYPEQQGTTLLFECNEPVELTLKLRYPGWADQAMQVLLNGQVQTVEGKPGSFIEIQRRWEHGDKLEMTIPFSMKAVPIPDNPDRIALKYGPLILAGDLGPGDDPSRYDLVYVPVMLTRDRDPSRWTRPLDEPNTFTTLNTGRPRDVALKPFYHIYDRTYTVYWDLSNEKNWKEREAKHLAVTDAFRALEERTIDYFQPGNITHERSHLFEGPQSTAHQFRNKSYRVSLPNGWFAFDMKVRPDEPVALNLEYWGGGYRREKSFDIHVDGTRIASEDITMEREAAFFTTEYEIPAELTRGKHKIRVEIRAQARRLAGPVYGVRTVTSK